MAILVLYNLLEWEDIDGVEVSESVRMVPEDLDLNLKAVLNNHPDIRSSELHKELADVNYIFALRQSVQGFFLSTDFGTGY